VILAIDTATQAVSLALHDGHSILAEMSWRTARHHTMELAPAVHDLMARAGVSARDLTAIAVVHGPGSYTGLRIGMSLAKGMALSRTPPIPLIGFPTLDVLAAAQPHTTDFLIAVAQAGRGRINAGHYRWNGAEWESMAPPIITTWAAVLESLDGPTQISGEIDPAGREMLEAVGDWLILARADQTLRRAGVLAELACRHLMDNPAGDPSALVPVYPGEE
jgi:tRNA threonylcarbamoyladenosine biosynthesis protein TsaB